MMTSSIGGSAFNVTGMGWKRFGPISPNSDARNRRD